MREWMNLLEKTFESDDLAEATWWVARWVSGSMNDPDWDFQKPTKLTLEQALEIVGQFVGNQSSTGKPLHRCLSLTKAQAVTLKKTMILPVNGRGFQGFTDKGEKEALEIGKELDFDGEVDVVISAMIPENEILFGMADLKRCARKPEINHLYHSLDSWWHQGEVFVQLVRPLKLLSVKIHGRGDSYGHED